MHRRTFLRCLPAAFATSLVPALAFATPAGGEGKALIAAWRCMLRLSPAGETLEAGPPTDYVGILAPDWEAGRIGIRQAIAVPNRVHGLVADPDGGFIAVAYRPGKWLMRCDAEGRVAQHHSMDSEPGGRTLDGHAVLDPAGEWLITTETVPESGQGWISLRNRSTLKKKVEWRTHGIEPHEARFDLSGKLLVANGGILRAPGDRKRNLDLMDSSLVRIDVKTGELLGQWRVRDQRLSLRHLAMGTRAAANGKPQFGIAMQAEHDEPAKRAAAPVLAVWDGEALGIPSLMPVGGGYCSDIVAGAGGGFYLNGERVNRVLHWQPENPGELSVIAELEKAGALAPWRAAEEDGVLIGSARGVGRWHPSLASGVLRWPIEMALDNHWTTVAGQG